MPRAINTLLVDDERVILRLMTAILQNEGFSINTAASAEEAKRVLHDRSFELVVTDLRMESDTAGFEVVRAAAQLHPKPAIAILTAFPVPATVWRPMGANALIQKGSDPALLAEKLRKLIPS